MIAALLLALALVSPAEYDAAQVGDTRHQTQAAFDTQGIRVYKWAGETGDLHLRKSYPAQGGGTVVVDYVKPSAAVPYRLVAKAWTA